jgi:type IV pilus assembly protein PilE
VCGEEKSTTAAAPAPSQAQMPRDGAAQGMARSIAARQTQVASSCQAWTDGPATRGQRNGNATSPARTAPTALDGRAAASAGAAREVIPPIVPTGRADEWRRVGDERFCGKTHLETFLDNCLQLLSALWREARNRSERCLLKKQASYFRRAVQARGGSSGFTLIEVMIVIAIVAILASIAVPSYNDYLRRGQVQEAPSTLSNFRAQMEQYYQDNRNYGSGTTCGIGNPVGKYFQYSCTTAGQTYTATASPVGTGGLVAGLTYTINEQNSQQTTCSSCAWNFSSPRSAWILRKP